MVFLPAARLVLYGPKYVLQPDDPLTCPSSNRAVISVSGSVLDRIQFTPSKPAGGSVSGSLPYWTLTTADATGVNIDPVTLTALALPGSDGKPVNFIDYGKAKLSNTGDEAPGPFTLKSGQTLPAPTVMFRRENPDEVCRVGHSDVSCPGIVVGTWRDIADFYIGGKLNDYDDGLPEVAPVRIKPDTFAPSLQNLTVRDSESLLLSFDDDVPHGLIISLVL